MAFDNSKLNKLSFCQRKLQHFATYKPYKKDAGLLQVNKIMDLLDHNFDGLNRQADEIIRRNKVRLYWNNVNLISAQTEIKTVGHLYAIANHIRRSNCNRVLILTSESESTHLLIAKSSDICYLDIKKTLEPLITKYKGRIQSDRDISFVHIEFYNPDIVSEVLDSAIELIIVALPYPQ